MLQKISCNQIQLLGNNLPFIKLKYFFGKESKKDIKLILSLML
jgi:hypothetical protein